MRLAMLMRQDRESPLLVENRELRDRLGTATRHLAFVKDLVASQNIRHAESVKERDILRAENARLLKELEARR